MVFGIQVLELFKKYLRCDLYPRISETFLKKTVIKVGDNWFIGPNDLENGSLEYYIGDF